MEEFNALLEDNSKTWNGAVSYATTGTNNLGPCLDYWSKAGTYSARSQEVVNADMEKIFADNEYFATLIVFGLRLITRTPNLEMIDEVQTGYGRKDEFHKAILWMHHHKRDLLYRNLYLIPVFGCWKDFLNETLINALDIQEVYKLFASNLKNELLKKYLPQIRSKSQLRTDRDKKRVLWAKNFCKFIGINYQQYRQIKSAGQAHIWQKQMSLGKWDDINFNGIPGKAMNLHTSRKGKKDHKTVFERHNLVERLVEWAESQGKVKFNGYPYELTQSASYKKNPSLYQKLIYNKQFESLIEPFKNHKLGNVFCAVDTSGSMQMQVAGKTTAYDICISMGVVFSSLNIGKFKDCIVSFGDTSKLIRLNGDFVERLHQIEKMTTAWGSTNFQSVIDLIVDIRKNNPEIPLNEYPETLLIVSDMQFNPAGNNTETNYKVAMNKLNDVGLGDIRIIWWYVNGAGKDFPAQMSDKGVYLIGGFDPANLKSLMGLHTEKKEFVAKEKQEETPVDGLINFLSQKIFRLVQI